MKFPDIDIDVADRDNAVGLLTSIPAMIHQPGERKERRAHPTGVYLQDMPVDPFTGLAALDHREAPEHGYFKIDLISTHAFYGELRDEDHLIDLMNREPPWELLDEPQIVEQLPHVYNHYDIIQEIAPRSIEDLAVVLALIRPGKRWLVGQPRAIIDASIWQDLQKGDFKKAHAIAYAAMIAAALNLTCDKLMAE